MTDDEWYRELMLGKCSVCALPRWYCQGWDSIEEAILKYEEA